MSGSRRYVARLEGIPLWVMPLPVLAVALFVGVFQQYGVAGGRAEGGSPLANQLRVGQKIAMGEGKVWSWLRYDERGNPTAVGATFTEAALSGLPQSEARTCCGGPEFAVALPPDPRVPFKEIVINWNPRGHEPVGIYDQPHFDFHFYLIDSALRQTISAEGADLARCTRPMPAGNVPAGYILAPGAIPKMGAHWVDPTSPEFSGKLFMKTFIYGSYDGRLTFIEPMITRAYLQSKPNSEDAIKVPAAYAVPGYYPTRYGVRYDPATREYSVALEGLTRR